MSEKFWFSEAEKPREMIKQAVQSDIEGVYCLWWKEERNLLKNAQVALPCGKRGSQNIYLENWWPREVDHIAIYVGKGRIRSRLLSHIKPSKQIEWALPHMVKGYRRGDRSKYR